MHKWFKKGIILLVSLSTLGAVGVSGITATTVTAFADTTSSTTKSDASAGLDSGAQQLLTTSQLQRLLKAMGEYADAYTVSGLRQFVATEAYKAFFDQDGYTEVENDLKAVPGSGPFLASLFKNNLLPALSGQIFSGIGSTPTVSSQYKAGFEAYQNFDSQVSDWFKSVPKTEVWQNFSDTYGTGKLHAYYLKNPKKTNQTIIAMHGYKQSAEAFANVAKMFYDMGYNVLLPDQRAHGESSGSAIDFGYYAKNDVVNWANKVNDMNGTDSKIMLYGASMGGGTVLQAAGQAALPKNVVGVIDDCGYSNVRELLGGIVGRLVSSVQDHFANRPLSPVYQPLVSLAVAIFNQDEFLNDMSRASLAGQGFSLQQVSPKDQIAKSQLPLLIFDNEDDNLIPYEESIENYKAAGTTDKNLVLLPATLGPHGSAHNDWINYQSQIKQFAGRIFANDKASNARLDFQNNLADASDINRSLYPADSLSTRDATIRTAWVSSLKSASDDSFQGLTAALDQYTASDPLQPTSFSNDAIRLTPGTNQAKSLSGSNYHSFYINVPKSGQYALNYQYSLKTLGPVDGRIFWNAATISTVNSSYGKQTNQTVASLSLPDIWKSTGTQKQLVYLPAGRQVIKVATNDPRINFKELSLALETGQDSLKLPGQTNQSETSSAANFTSASANGYYALVNNNIEYTNRKDGEYLYPLSNISKGSYEVRVHYATPRFRSSLNLDLLDAKGAVTSLGQHSLAANNAIWDNYAHYTDSDSFKMHLTSTDPQYLRMILHGTPANIQSISITKISDN